MTIDVTQWLWLAVAGYAVHILEEFSYDWKTWAIHVLRLPVDWATFYVTNAAVIVLGIVCATLGSRWPAVSLIFPALMGINALFFHVLPTLIGRKFSPGLITALLVFLPLLWAIYTEAATEGLLTMNVLLISTIGGVVVMAYPILLLKTKGLRLFVQ